MDNSYHFVTRWQVEGTCGEVADILGDPIGLARWWPSVYLDVQELADAILRLARDPALRLRLGERAASEVRQHWSFDSYIDRLEAAYSAIVEAHRAGRLARLPGSGT